MSCVASYEIEDDSPQGLFCALAAKRREILAHRPIEDSEVASPVCTCGCGATACIHGKSFNQRCMECECVSDATQFDKLWITRVIAGHSGHLKLKAEGRL